LTLAIHGGPAIQQRLAPASDLSRSFSLIELHQYLGFTDLTNIRFFNLLRGGHPRRLRTIIIFANQEAPWFEDHTIFTSSNLDMLGLTTSPDEPNRVWDQDYELPLEDAGKVLLEPAEHNSPLANIQIYVPVAFDRYVDAGRWSVDKVTVYRPGHGTAGTMLERRGLPADEIEERWDRVWVALQFYRAS